MMQHRNPQTQHQSHSLFPHSSIPISNQTIIHPLFYTIWSRFEADICSYILPALSASESIPSPSKSNTNMTGSSTSTPAAKFNLAYSLSQLRKSLVIHGSMDIFTQIRNQTTKIFYRISHAFVNECFKAASSQSIEIVDAVQLVYLRAKQRIEVFVDCLFLVLAKYITKAGIQDQIYSIINKELVNHVDYDQYVNSCLNLIERQRNRCLMIQSTSDPEMQEMAVVRLVVELKIFPYTEYMDRSKKYYHQILEKIPKNIWMFSIVYHLIKCEKMLQVLIVPTEEQLQNAKKCLWTQRWRALENETIISVLSKEVLEEIFQHMVEFLDYLVCHDNNSQISPQMEDQGIGRQPMQEERVPEFVISAGQKKQILKYFWQMTKILQKSHRQEKKRGVYRTLSQSPQGQFNSSRRKYQQRQRISPMEKLLERICQIVGDIKKFINPSKQTKECELYKIVHFKDNMLAVIAECFQAQARFSHAVTAKVYQTVQQEQQIYNSKLCKIILNESYRYPDPSRRTKTAEKPNNSLSPQLFKLTPSKQNFMPKFEHELSKYILQNWKPTLDLTHQQKFIRPMQVEIGHSLSRNVEKMVTDVWRSGRLVDYSAGILTCRVLGNYWPKFVDSNFRLADMLLQIRDDFEKQFLAHPENDKKKLKWVEEEGRIKISIGGIESTFSQMQASIIMLINRSYRPLKPHQLKQILQSGGDVEPILKELAKNNILTHCPDINSYEINFQNITSFVTSRGNQVEPIIVKKSAQRDTILILEYSIARLLKRRKSIQKTDLSRILSSEGNIKSSIGELQMEDINQALERLVGRDVAIIEKTRGIIKYQQ